MHTKQLLIRCRAVIVHENRLLVVKHRPENDFYALPGGHLEYGEDIQECLVREIIEELGVTPTIGTLLYVNNFIENEHGQSIEFFFEVTNGEDFMDSEKLPRSHAHEIDSIYWAAMDETIKILPAQLATDFKEGKLLSDVIRYIKK